MRRTILAAVSALALSMAGAGLAQVQLAQEVADQLTQLGIDQTLVVTEEQVLQIENILNSDESDEEKVRQINALLEMD